MTKTIKKIVCGVGAAIFLYTIIWYSWGIYVKKVLLEAMNNSSSYVATTDKIELSGFPFKLVYSFDNLNLTSQDSNNKAAITIKNPILKLNMRLSKVSLDITRIVVTTPDNKQNFSVDFDNGAMLLIKLRSSYAYEVLSAQTSGLFKGLTLDNIKKVQYSDMGYLINDAVLEKVVFVSTHNTLGVDLTSSDRLEEIAVVANISGEGSGDSPAYLVGPLNLNADFLVKLKQKEQKEGAVMNYGQKIEGVELSFNKFTFTAPEYNMLLSGGINVMNSAQSTTGLVNFQLNGLPNFLTMISSVYGEKNANYVKGLFCKMTGAEEGSALEKIDIQIKGEDKNIKFGNATIIDLLLYSIHG